MNARSRNIGELVLIEEALREQFMLYRWLRGCNLRNHGLMIVWHSGNDLQQNNLNHVDLRSWGSLKIEDLLKPHLSSGRTPEFAPSMANYEVTCHILLMSQFKAEEILQEVFSPCHDFYVNNLYVESELVSNLKAPASVDVTCRALGLDHCNPMSSPP